MSAVSHILVNAQRNLAGLQAEGVEKMAALIPGEKIGKSAALPIGGETT